MIYEITIISIKGTTYTSFLLSDSCKFLSSQTFVFDNNNPSKTYFYIWNARDVAYNTAYLMEKALTAIYVISHAGSLPPEHKRPNLSNDPEKAIQFLNSLKNAGQ